MVTAVPSADDADAGAAVHRAEAAAVPWVQIRDLLAPEVRDRLTAWVHRAVQRLGADPSWYPADRPVGDDPLALDDDLRRALVEAISGLVPVVRRELGVPHFRVGGVELVAWVQHPDGSFAGPRPEPLVEVGDRHIELIYHVDAVPPDGGLRLLDRDPDGVPDGALVAVPAVANAVVFFPSTVHHEMARARDAEGVHIAVRGWITAAEPSSRPRTEFGVRMAELQQRHVPRLSASGFEVHPTPPAVHDLLRSLLELRGARRRPEDADRVYHLADDNDLIDITDLTDEVLAALQPMLERFAGVPLVPSALFGLRSYRAGARLAMHVDRLATHIASAVIQVAQDVDEPWPLQLDLDGTVHEILLSPGQMVLYEGASTPHGRITPLRGRSFVNAFAHYRPVGWDWSNEVLFERAGTVVR